MTELDLRFKEIVRQLNKRKVKYLLIGGHAVAVYGFIRNTQDFDLMVRNDLKNLEKTLNALENANMRSSFPKDIEEISESNHTMFISKNQKEYDFQIDIWNKNKEEFDKLWKNRKKGKYMNSVINIISKNDLIEMKKKSEREKDKIDVKELKKV